MNVDRGAGQCGLHCMILTPDPLENRERATVPVTRGTPGVVPRFWWILLLSLILHTAGAFADEPGASRSPPQRGGESGEEAADEDSFWSNVHGDFLTRYVLRARDTESDQDLYQSLRLWGRDGGEGRFRFLLHGLVTLDMDGRAGSEHFADRGNTYDSNGHGYLYSAYGEARDFPRGLLGRLRLGRQFVYLPETFHLDGITIRTAPWKGLSAHGLAGVPVHLYEGSRGGDAIAGGGLTYEPRGSVRIGADYVHVEDEKYGLVDEVDDLYSVNALTMLGSDTRLGGRASWIDGQFRRLEGRLSSRWEGGGLSGGVRVAWQPETLREFTTGLSPYYSVLLAYRPYLQVLGTMEKEITKNLDLELGGGTRQLLDEDDEGPFNREFSRVYLTVHGVDLPVKKLSVSLTGEAWLTEEDDVYSAGGEVTWRPDTRWKASTGYYYSLFKIDRITLEERERVQTTFVRLRGPLVGPLSFRGSYEAEWDGGPVYHVIETAVRLGF